jgi:(p)ppGpp synthase/HD superfamily hydrolase
LDLGPLERALAQTTLAPYIVKAMALIGVPRKAGSNMFRHQMSTFAILLDYKVVDPVLLKASVIHDLFETFPDEPWLTRECIASIDGDGPAVYDLVQEVTIRVVNGVREPKAVYLRRVMETGSNRARRLKLADRISNLVTLGFVNDVEFIARYTAETRQHILPFSAAVSVDMHRELSDLVDNRTRQMAQFRFPSGD